MNLVMNEILLKCFTQNGALFGEINNALLLRIAAQGNKVLRLGVIVVLHRFKSRE